MQWLVIIIYFGVPVLAYRRTKAAAGETKTERILPKLKNAFLSMGIVGAALGAFAAATLASIKSVDAADNWLYRFYESWTGLGLPLGTQIFYFVDMWMIWGLPLGLFVICIAKDKAARKKRIPADRLP
ncbi:MAG: hypothetical protein LBU06_09485 [Desulfovibrio sp.]|jgi:hypothetical protein|nr:hypothetical protein [Desulfovibrio sp.]